MLRFFNWTTLVLVICSSSPYLNAENISTKPYKFSGYMFGDLYYVFSNHVTTFEGQNGFWFRRIYFTYDYNISKVFSVRFRTEMNSADFTKDSRSITPFVKDAYLKWKTHNYAVLIGISPTPTWNLIEHFWGYRSVEKNALDLYKFGSSRDFGVAVLGKLGPYSRMEYHLMLANGEGKKSENNQFKKLMGSFTLYLPYSLLQVYGDWEKRQRNTSITTYQGFIGIKLAKLKVGIQYAQQIRLMESNTQTSHEVVSGFLILLLSKNMTILVRYDKMFDPAPSGIPYIPLAPAKSNLLIAGIDITPVKDVHFIPNVEYVFYNETNGDKPNPDLYLRLTFYFKFE